MNISFGDPRVGPNTIFNGTNDTIRDLRLFLHTAASIGFKRPVSCVGDFSRNPSDTVRLPDHAASFLNRRADCVHIVQEFAVVVPCLASAERQAAERHIGGRSSRGKPSDPRPVRARSTARLRSPLHDIVLINVLKNPAGPCRAPFEGTRESPGNRRNSMTRAPLTAGDETGCVERETDLRGLLR